MMTTYLLPSYKQYTFLLEVAAEVMNAVGGRSCLSAIRAANVERRNRKKIARASIIQVCQTPFYRQHNLSFSICEFPDLSLCRTLAPSTSGPCSAPVRSSLRSQLRYRSFLLPAVGQLELCSQPFHLLLRQRQLKVCQFFPVCLTFKI